MKSISKYRISEKQNSNGKSSSVFNWSPLSARKLFSFKSKKSKHNEAMPTASYLYPNYDDKIWLRSCEQDIIEPLTGTCKGNIPPWLNGTLIRNGPGSLKVGDEYFQHLFDSSALLHRFAINNGKVTYQCRFLQSDAYKKNWEAKRIVYDEFGTKALPDPCRSIFQKISTIFNSKGITSDNAAISVYPFCDELYAFSETSVLHRINKETLETEKKVDVCKHVAIVNHTSHPHVMEDGSVFNLAMSSGKGGTVHNIICFPAKTEDGTRQDMFEKAFIVASIPARWPFHPSYMHTFGITDHYFIIVEQPLSLSVTSILNPFRSEPFTGCFKWYPNEQTRINVICRSTGKLLQIFQADPFAYMHIINQYETTNYIVLDICCYRDPAFIDAFYIETIKNMQYNPDYAKMFRGRPLRFILPMKADICNTTMNYNLIDFPTSKAEAYLLQNGSIYVKPEILCNLTCELPRINYEKHLGKPYKYFYAMSSDVDTDNPGAIIKTNLLEKTYVTWCEDNCYLSETVFVASPNAQSEDDGVILSTMVWGGDDTNHVGLLILDAKTFKEIGRAEFYTPSPVPRCFHGWFLPQYKKT